MPVEDHAVHEKVKAGSDFRYGCWNKDRDSPGYYAPDRVYGKMGIYSPFKVQLTFIEHRMSRECRYDGAGGKDNIDPACEGCKHIGSDYVDRITNQ